VLVRKAVRLLDLNVEDEVLDLFCGLGNFSLAIASIAARVTGVEGSETLIRRAQTIAVSQGLSSRVNFVTANLFTLSDDHWLAFRRFKKILIDPPREGAQQVCELIAKQASKPGRIVYISCNPATLARDAAILVHQADYILESAGVANMFPQTSHVESVAVFTRSE
jgi:23S rRNA (uracil1939-C5)-methyltransferase